MKTSLKFISGQQSAFNDQLKANLVNGGIAVNY